MAGHRALAQNLPAMRHAAPADRPRTMPRPSRLKARPGQQLPGPAHERAQAGRVANPAPGG